MTELESNENISRFFRKYLPSDINIGKDEIFYRDKYNEIINYIKIIIKNSQDLELYQYLKPKGTILINLNPGTDIIDFLRVISSNYYLEYFELNYYEILKTPEEFFKNFDKILNFLQNSNSEETEEQQDKETKNIKTKKPVKSKQNIKKLIIINQIPKLNKILKEKSLLNYFLNLLQTINSYRDFISNHLILVWLNYDYKELVENSEQISKNFDLYIKIPLLNKIERETYLKNLSEKNPKIVFDINAIVNYTEDWEINDLKQLLKMGIFKHFLTTNLNDITNEITDTLTSLIESGEYVISNTLTIPKSDNSNDIKYDPNSESKKTENNKNQKESIEKKDEYISQIRDESISEFMINQLYENAASKHYSELLIIIDKLNKKEYLEDNDRKLLAKYPFILNDIPNMAQINLEKAKKRIDLIKRAYGK